MLKIVGRPEKGKFVLIALKRADLCFLSLQQMFEVASIHPDAGSHAS